MRISTIKVIFIILALIYFFLPVDLLPDFLGLVGRIDDFLLIVFLYWRYRTLLAHFRAKFAKESLQQEQKKQSSRAGTEAVKTPYEILGLKKNASKQEIQKAYKDLVKLYHPDLVNHLGDELKDLANKKMKEIHKAYETLKH